jgi:hypothetical protein
MSCFQKDFKTFSSVSCKIYFMQPLLSHRRGGYETLRFETLVSCRLLILEIRRYLNRPMTIIDPLVSASLTGF